MSADTVTVAPPRKPITISQQLLFSLVSVNMLVTVLFSVAYYVKQKNEVMTDTDRMLYAVATLARDNLPADYHDRITGPSSVSDSEYQRIVDHNNRLCVSLGLEYIWSLMVVDGRIVFTSATSPDKVAANRKHAAFFELHTNPQFYIPAFESMMPTYSSSHDKWGHLRVALLPFYDGQGRKYLFGACYSLADVDRQLQETVWQAASIGGLLLAASMALALIITGWISRPISRLTETIQGIGAGKRDLVAPEGGSYEQVVLARQFNRMNRALQQRISGLESETRQSREELLMSEQRYRGLLNFAVDGILIGSHAGVILDANECMCALFGMAWDEIIGKSILEMPFTPESIASIPFRYDLLQKGESVTSERSVRRSDGSEITVEMHTKMMADGTYQSIYHDITERKRVEQSLRESEARYRQLFEMESDAIFLIDNETGQILDVNQAAQTLYGYSRDELLSKRNVDLSAEPEQTKQATQKAEEEKPALLRILLRKHRKSDGTGIPVEITARGFLLNGRGVHIAAIRDITERRKAQEVLESWNASLERRVVERTAEVGKYARQLQALTGRLVRVEETERQRITDVLHEDLQQTLVAARMSLGSALGTVKGAAAKVSLNAVDDMLTRSIRLTRTLVHDIAVPAVREGEVHVAVEWLAQQMQEKFGMTVQVAADEGVEPVGESVYLCLYRAVQELLFNVSKHAGVRQAAVTIRMAGAGTLRVTVSDAGRGFSALEQSDFEKEKDGFGLFSIRERVEGLGGRMEIVSAEGQGTTVILTVPAHKAAS